MVMNHQIYLQQLPGGYNNWFKKWYMAWNKSFKKWKKSVIRL